MSPIEQWLGVDISAKGEHQGLPYTVNTTRVQNFRFVSYRKKSEAKLVFQCDDVNEGLIKESKGRAFRLAFGEHSF